MLSPRARKALAIIATVIAAFLISIISLAYLLYLSPNAKAARLERLADNHLYVAREIISVMSTIAEIENRTTSLKKAAEHRKSEGKQALAEAKVAKEGYESLFKTAKLSKEARERINRKIECSKHLIKGAKNYIDWLIEAKKGVDTIKYTYQSYKWQSKGLNRLNQAILEINAGRNKKVLQSIKDIRTDFRNAQEAVLKARSKFSNRDIAQLDRMVQLFIQAVKSLEKMAKTDENDIDTYNRAQSQLNKAATQASKIAAKRPVVKDLNIWLERNFYYQGGELIFHYKKAIEIWPE